MKLSSGIGFILAVLFCCGCSKQDNPPASTAPPASGGGGYVGAMVKGEQSAVKTIDNAALNQEIQLFNVQEGRFPTNLNELVARHYVGQLPAAPVGMKLDYDATQGKVAVVKQ